MKARSDRIPKRIAGYKIIRQLGGGGMGIVYLAHSRRGQMVALKVIRPEHSDSDEFRRRFGREAESASAVQGTCVARVVDCDTSGRQAYIASEFVNGPTLEEYVQRHGPLQGGVLRAFALALAEALGAIHRAGIVHRDLKPSNVLLTADGPKVIDFGIARAADASAITSTGTALGTPSWMAPEQARGEKATEAADVFAWGALVAYAATGIPPFGQGSADAMLYRVVHEEPSLDGVSDALRSLVAGALEKDPSTRPSVAALASQLLNDETVVGVDQTVSARVADTLAETWDVPDSFERSAFRRRRLILPVGAGVIAAAGLIAAGFLFWVPTLDSSQGPAAVDREREPRQRAEEASPGADVGEQDVGDESDDSALEEGTMALSGEGIGFANFGDPAGEVIPKLASLLGEPEVDEFIDCGVELRQLAWKNLAVLFFRDSPQSLAGYFLSDGRPLLDVSTDREISIGSSVSDLRNAYGPDIDFYSEAADIPDTFVVTDGLGGLAGWASNTTDNGVVGAIYVIPDGCELV